MIDTIWRDNFCETCQDILEDALLLEALSYYTSSNRPPVEDDIFPKTFTRLSDYLSQHTSDLRTLKKRLDRRP